LEASRAYIEATAERLDAGEELLNTEGAIAKYLASEAGNDAADAAIQALGGYGYTKEYMVEKYKRDVRITTIYEGTSEIMEMTIARDRWQHHLKSRGAYYRDRAAALDTLDARHPEIGAGTVALAMAALAEVLEMARIHRLTRNQHVLFRLGELISWVEGAEALAVRAGRAKTGDLPPKSDERFDASGLAPISRVFAREAALRVAQEGTRWVLGAADAGSIDAATFEKAVGVEAIRQAQDGLMQDMDRVADVVYERT
ncbi:MAG: acyl-CoA dehydrogenase family protein, partial [Acidimicrobiia bacterium]|nr:acyl-CoA dehydrogenase family protein [Acidimicrobiia bacterium]